MPESTDMQLRYELKFRDFFLFNTMHQFMSPTLQIFNLACALLMPVLLDDINIAGRVILAVAAYLAIWAMQVMFNVVYLFSSKNQALLTVHAIALTEAGFVDETSFQKSLYYWHGIHKLVQRPGFVAVYLSPYYGVIIPKRAFAGDGQRNGFVQAIAGKMTQQDPMASVQGGHP